MATNIADSAGQPRLAVIAGPTASGKSALALALAERTGGVIVNADASQLYRELRALTARPNAADERRAEHRLYGVAEGAQPWSAAQWAARARREIEDVHAGGGLPILVGGTGLYLRTLLHGIAPVPAIDEGVRAAVRALPPAEARAALEREDPRSAARLAPGDRLRTARALEVIRSTGRAIGAWQEEQTGGLAAHVRWRAIVILPERQAHDAGIDSRFARMVAGGALDEVAALKSLGLDRGLPVMKAVGVPPLLAYLDGLATLEEAVARGCRDSRRYAKRQRTWFRHQTPGWERLRQPGPLEHETNNSVLGDAMTLLGLG